jgi:hypothetical protein
MLTYSKRWKIMNISSISSQNIFSFLPLKPCIFIVFHAFLFYFLPLFLTLFFSAFPTTFATTFLSFKLSFNYLDFYSCYFVFFSWLFLVYLSYHIYSFAHLSFYLSSLLHFLIKFSSFSFPPFYSPRCSHLSVYLLSSFSCFPLSGWIAEMTKRFFCRCNFLHVLLADYRAARAEETSVKRGDKVRKEAYKNSEN